MDKRNFLRAAVALAAFGALGIGAAQAQAPIKIGSFLAVTGGASFLGDPEAKTLKLYVEQMNKQRHQRPQARGGDL